MLISNGFNSESPTTLPLFLIKVTLEFNASASLSASASASSMELYLPIFCTDNDNKFACFSNSSTICNLNVFVRSLSATT